MDREAGVRPACDLLYQRLRDELQSTSWKRVAEEASEAYKDIDEVVKPSHEVGIGRPVAKVIPVNVMKG